MKGAGASPEKTKQPMGNKVKKRLAPSQQRYPPRPCSGP